MFEFLLVFIFKLLEFSVIIQDSESSEFVHFDLQCPDLTKLLENRTSDEVRIIKKEILENTLDFKRIVVYKFCNSEICKAKNLKITKSLKVEAEVRQEVDIDKLKEEVNDLKSQVK